MAGKGLIHSPPKSNAGLLAAFQSALQRFPAFQPFANDYSVVAGRPMVQGDDRQLETYAPDESWNPIPGKATTEVYNQAPGEVNNLVAGDMLHHLADVDPTWAGLKAGVVPQGMDKFRGDEFLMGYLTPDKQNDWAKVYTPEQRKKLERMRMYLQGMPFATGGR